MASKTKLILIFSAVLLVLAAFAMAVEECEPGQAFPHDPLPGCRAYVLRRCAGNDPPGVRARCCHQLREVEPACRCEALQAMVDVLVEEEAAKPECRKGAMAAIAAGLPARAECDLETLPHGHGVEHYCPLLHGRKSEGVGKEIC